MILPQSCCSDPRGSAIRFHPACSRLRHSLKGVTLGLTGRMGLLSWRQPRKTGESPLRSLRSLSRMLIWDMAMTTMTMTSKPLCTSHRRSLSLSHAAKETHSSITALSPVHMLPEDKNSVSAHCIAC